MKKELKEQVIAAIKANMAEYPNFYITDKTQTWDQFLPNEDEARFVQAKSYVYLRVRLLFDPPQNSTAVKSIEENIREYEWLLYVDADPPFPHEED